MSVNKDNNGIIFNIIDIQDINNDKIPVSNEDINKSSLPIPPIQSLKENNNIKDKRTEISKKDENINSNKQKRKLDTTNTDNLYENLDVKKNSLGNIEVKCTWCSRYHPPRYNKSNRIVRICEECSDKKRKYSTSRKGDKKEYWINNICRIIEKNKSEIPSDIKIKLDSVIDELKNAIKKEDVDETNKKNVKNNKNLEKNGKTNIEELKIVENNVYYYIILL